MTDFLVLRDITVDECDWLNETVKEGTIVYKCVKPTYGCIGWNGTGVTFNSEGDYPFFELPNNALQKLPIR